MIILLKTLAISALIPTYASAVQDSENHMQIFDKTKDTICTMIIGQRSQSTYCFSPHIRTVSAEWSNWYLEGKDMYDSKYTKVDKYTYDSLISIASSLKIIQYGVSAVYTVGQSSRRVFVKKPDNSVVIFHLDEPPENRDYICPLLLVQKDLAKELNSAMQRILPATILLTEEVISFEPQE